MANTDSTSHGVTLRSLLSYLPLVLVFISLVATATAAQFQIAANKEAIAENKQSITLRVPQFLYDQDQGRIKEELIELAGGVDTNEEVLRQIERSTDQLDGKIELEIERLRALIREADREQAAQLETILRLLEAQQ